jgi:osmotically-inducible protein OsmY
MFSMTCRESDPLQQTLKSRVQQSIRCSQNPSFRELAVNEENGAIILSGQLPSYYLKQMVQTIACSVDGVRRLENRVEVVRRPKVVASA